MPYVASNRDAREQESFKTALMGATVAIGAIAMGGNALKKVGVGGYNGNKVAKDIYGKQSNRLTSDVVDGIRVRNANDISDNGMKAYNVVNGRKGPRIKAKGGNPVQNFMNTHMDDNVKAFNKKISSYSNASDGVYSTSKLSLYDGLYDDTEKAGIGLTSKQLTGLTNDIYDSAPNQIARGDNYTLANDADISNSIWGKGPSAREVRENFTGMHPAKESTRYKYKKIYGDAYKEKFGSDIQEDIGVQRGRSDMWGRDIKAQAKYEQSETDRWVNKEQVNAYDTLINNRESNRRTGNRRDSYRSFWKNADLESRYGDS